jgi:hypothetical protein
MVKEWYQTEKAYLGADLVAQEKENQWEEVTYPQHAE